MRVLLFGAGASAGTVPGPPGIPVASGFGAALGALDPAWRRSYPAIAKVVRHMGLSGRDFGLEPVWTCIDYYAKLEEALPTKRTWRNESRQMKKALLRVYGERCDQVAQRLPVRARYTLADLMKRLQPGDLLVSFNYDTLVERLAIRHRRRLLSVGVRGLRGRASRAVHLSKPHGSCAWAMDFSSNSVRFCESDGKPLVRSLQPKVVDAGVEPLVLGAVPIKSELIREVQRCWPDIFRVVIAQWRAVVSGLVRANSVIIVGYSFPREDQYGRFMIREAMRLRNQRKRRKLRVEFYELRHLAAERSEAVRDAFGDAIEWPLYKGPVAKPAKMRTRR